MRGRPVGELVYEYMFPRPRPTDAQNFATFVNRNLVPEVRQEVHSFYGHLDTQEAKYPGLDYSARIHRTRLSRWPWHRRLFRAFNGLQLTEYEIAELTKWEGTKWAKERYENDSGVVIKDTAADEVGQWIEPEDRVQGTPLPPREDHTRMIVEEEDVDTANEEMVDEDSDGELESVGVSLNQRLRAVAARRELNGDTTEPLDEEWEQWLKTAFESGDLPFVADHDRIQSQFHDVPVQPEAFFPPRMLAAARAGHWHEIPDILHGMIRRTIGSAPTPAGHESSTASGTHSARRRTYSDLRLPVGARGPRNSTTMSDVRS